MESSCLDLNSYRLMTLGGKNFTGKGEIYNPLPRDEELAAAES